MKLSIKIYYALLALLELANNINPNEIISIKQIAKNNKIPLNFLEQILATLKKTNIVGSIRGKEGGYQLKMKPSDISIYIIIKALIGNIKIFETKSLNNNVINNYFISIEKEIISKFEKTSLEDLLHEQNKIKKVINFTI